MSYSIDTNVLLYATFEESSHHEISSAFLDTCRRSAELLCLTWPVLMSYLRLSTHAKIWRRPLSAEEAQQNVESLLALPQVRTLGSGGRFWECYRGLATQLPIRANLVPDAQIAAILLEHGVTVLYTNDRDFRKFDGLEPRRPDVVYETSFVHEP